MAKMTLDSCLQKFRETVGEVVNLGIVGPNEDGDYLITADDDIASLHQDGSFNTNSTTLATSLEKHFGQFREWFAANMAPPAEGPDSLPTGDDEVIEPEQVPDFPKEAKVAVTKPKKKMAPRTFDARAMQIDNLTIEDVMADFQTDPPLTRQEAKKFILMCVAKKLNPYLGEVYIVKYTSQKTGESKASIIVGKEAFMRKADEHPAYQGMRAGVVVLKEGKEDPTEREGTIILPNETLVGGWAEVFRSDRKPTKAIIALGDYDTGKKMWVDKKGTMIRKVAIVQAQREAFAGDFGGMYAPTFASSCIG